MAKQTNLNIRIDQDLKKEFTELCNDLGLNTSTAMIIFIKAFLRKQGIPFEVSREVPNAETLAAMKEVEEMKKNPGVYKGDTDIDQMMKKLLA